LQRCRSGQYVDSRVWTFTPAHFLDQLAELGRLGVLDFVVDGFLPTLPDNLEFYVVLRRLPRGIDSEAARKRQAAGLADRDSAEHVAALSVQIPGQRLVDAQARLDTALTDVESVRMQRDEANARIAILESELAAVPDSKRWRVGGLVTTPASAILRATRRRR
jgi:hypothetical protein